jgi:hypothetical protein
MGSPPSPGTFGIFGVAAGFTYLLAVFSVNCLRQALPGKFWPILRKAAMTYIAFAFILDFKRLPLSDFRQSIEYLPFAALAISAPLLRAAAWAQILGHKLRMPV